jgi:hypothetical protein
MGDSDTKFLLAYQPNRIGAPTTREIHDVSIIVDLTLAEGKYLKSIVDYAAMVGLAEIQLGSSPPGSILSLFNSAAGGGRLTADDQTFLVALYDMPLDRPAYEQRQMLVNALTTVNKTERREADRH